MAVRSISRAAAFLLAALAAFGWGVPALADSSSPNLAAFYDRQMAIVDGAVYGWRGSDAPKAVAVTGAVQVGVGYDKYYVLTGEKVLLRFADGFRQASPVMTDVASFAAGQDGVLAVKTDASLWLIDGLSGGKTKIADGVLTAAVGDSANYYVTETGDLYVKGKAHRGQYGDGRMKSTSEFVKTAENVARINAHTGHAILLTKDGDVLGTGGNIYGPVGRHGLGDKAVRWSKIMGGARAMATGSSHTFAIRQDGMLMGWGRAYGPEPVPVMAGVSAVAAGSSTVIALKTDGSLWQWQAGGTPKRVLGK